MTQSLPNLSQCPGSDDWNEDTGRRILNAEDRRIRELFPEFRRVAALPGQCIWEGPLQPFAQPYRVRLIWSLGVRGATVRSAYSSPMVLVLDPPLIFCFDEDDGLSRRGLRVALADPPDD